LVRKLALLLIVVAVMYSGWSFAQDAALEGLPIGSIDTEGNVTIKRARILSAATVKVGESFQEAVVTKDVELIGAIEGVERAWYNAEAVEGRVKLTFVVVEKNLIRSINILGNRKMSANKLISKLGFKPGDYLDVFLARNGVDVLTELYHKEGYAFVGVSLDEGRLSLGQIAYSVVEGPRVKIKKVQFRGNEMFKNSELHGVIKTEKRKFWIWQAYYNAKTVEEDLRKLQEAYQKRGFLNSQLTTDVTFSDDKAAAVVAFVIDEGPMFTVDKIEVSGNEFFDDSSLLEGTKLKEGEAYSSAKAEYDAKQIRKHYHKHGFVDVQVERSYSFVEGSKIAAGFDITEGRQFRIGRINIAGNESVHDKVVRRILDEEDFRPGQWFDGDSARGDGTGRLENIVQRSIRATSVSIQAVGDKADQRDANVSIEEGMTGDIQVGAGFDFDSGLVGHVVYNEQNFDISDIPKSWREVIAGEAFKGAGQQLRVSVSPGTKLNTFSVGFKEPFLYDQPVAFDLIGSGWAREQESYDEDRLKGYVGLTKRYDDDWRRGISFRAENVEISDIDYDAPKEVKDVHGNNDVFGLRLFIKKDTTDNRFRPSVGHIFDAGYEQVGGDHNFGVVSATQRWYMTLHEDLAERKTILETKVRGATIAGGDAPIFEKFYAGGTRSLRGFDYRGVSTRGLQTNVVNPERKDPIGSDWIITGSSEIAIPLSSEVVSALFFIDAGAIDTGGIRASVGTGIQIMVPMFGEIPMRFEFATPFLKEDEDETRVFTFYVGALF
jgi:outer membrane protein insertion porin family